MAQDTRQVYAGVLDAGSFRLLQIARGSLNNDIAGETECSPQVHSLADSSPYTALSYCWNEPQAVRPSEETKQRYVGINGQKIPVTANLYLALSHLGKSHHANDGGLFWFDSLCINQGSDVERTSQVSIMHLIYRRSTSVYIWLGPDLDGGVYMAREFLRFLMQKYLTEDPSLTTISHSIGFLDNMNKLNAGGLPLIHATIWRQALNFWELGWFSRIWVQQEVALARQAFFWCGDVEFIQDELVMFSMSFERSGLSRTLITLRVMSYDPVRNIMHISRRTFVGR